MSKRVAARRYFANRRLRTGGEFGGDILHRVQGPAGQFLGTILWECKRTKAWNDVWLAKLRDDQRSVPARPSALEATGQPTSLIVFGPPAFRGLFTHQDIIASRIQPCYTLDKQLVGHSLVSVSLMRHPYKDVFLSPVWPAGSRRTKA
jgi:Uncharacterized protein conserved in bacteria (DUF2130)